MMENKQKVAGRFAPSPSGRMHLGNIYAALISYLAAKSSGGEWILRIEDIDPQRSKMQYARQIEDDLRWLGMHWDRGGINDGYLQSTRSDIYQKYFDILDSRGILYPCHCRRADILATQAPHASDGRVVYAGTCRPPSQPYPSVNGASGAVRLLVPDQDITFTDAVYGPQTINLSHYCGDFIIRRADGAWAYQLAVVIDDALMGVNQIVRGNDLLLSTAQQLYLYNLLGFPAPHYAHLPLLCNTAGQRLSKRDASLAMDALRNRYSPEQLLGIVAHAAQITPTAEPISLDELIPRFSIAGIPTATSITVDDN